MCIYINIHVCVYLYIYIHVYMYMNTYAFGSRAWASEAERIRCSGRQVAARAAKTRAHAKARDFDIRPQTHMALYTSCRESSTSYAGLV